MPYLPKSDSEISHAVAQSHANRARAKKRGLGANAPIPERLLSYAWHRCHVYGVPAEEATAEVVHGGSAGMGRPVDRRDGKRFEAVLAIVRDPTRYELPRGVVEERCAALFDAIEPPRTQLALFNERRAA